MEAKYLQFPVVTFHLWFYWNIWTPVCLEHLWCAHVFDMSGGRRAGHDGAAGLWETLCKYGSVLWRQHFIGLTCCTGAWSGLETQMWPFRASGYFMFKHQKLRNTDQSTKTQLLLQTWWYTCRKCWFEICWNGYKSFVYLWFLDWSAG